jgi:hypothetical protein
MLALCWLESGDTDLATRASDTRALLVMRPKRLVGVPGVVSSRRLLADVASRIELVSVLPLERSFRVCS